MFNILKDVLEVVTSIAIIFGVVFAYLQIKKVSKAVEVTGKSNFIKVLGNFTKEYDTLMVEMVDCKTHKKIDVWYFRLWNLYTNEFVFFYQGILDPLIFEFWAFKLCLYYDKKPSKIPIEEIDTYKKSHLIYMKNRYKSYPKTDSFYRELIEISNNKRNEIRTEDLVHKLVEKYRQFK